MQPITRSIALVAERSRWTGQTTVYPRSSMSRWMVPNLSNRSPPRNIEVEDVLPYRASRYKSNAMAETTLSLESLTLGELEEVIVDRLHERRSVGPAVDCARKNRTSNGSLTSSARAARDFETACPRPFVLC